MADWTEFEGTIIDKPGKYLTKIVAVAEGFTKGGKLQLQLKFKTLEGNEFIHSFTIQSNTMWIISKFLKDLGLSEEERKDIRLDKKNPEICMPEILDYFNKHVIGKITEITLDYREYNGKQYLNMISNSEHYAGIS